MQTVFHDLPRKKLKAGDTCYCGYKYGDHYSFTRRRNTQKYLEQKECYDWYMSRPVPEETMRAFQDLLRNCRVHIE